MTMTMTTTTMSTWMTTAKGTTRSERSEHNQTQQLRLIVPGDCVRGSNKTVTVFRSHS